MREINKVGIIGSEETGTKIGELFFKTGFKVVLGEKGYTKELSDADVIIEALPLDFQLKKEALCKCDEKGQPNAILATTASGGITEIAAATGRPERIIGLNFTFNPFEKKVSCSNSERARNICRNC